MTKKKGTTVKKERAAKAVLSPPKDRMQRPFKVKWCPRCEKTSISDIRCPYCGTEYFCQ
ncbi:MAG: hypothetical protein PHI12_14655 [Dehalococcoidales bacterium]|nr:hypothetical protein [Dehalococcoidales bacterium]